jgi:hypothetical protein
LLTRLLDALGQSQLAGDIAEELHEGRSAAWACWQVSAAIVSGIVVEARRHPVLTVRAVALACLAFFAVRRALAPAFPFLQVLSELYLPTPSHLYMAATYEWVDGVKVWRREMWPLSWQSALFDPLLSLGMNFVASVLAGCVVGASHGKVRVTVVTIAALTVMLIAWPPSLWPRTPVMPPDVFPVLAVTYIDYLHQVVPPLVVIGVLLGGGLGRRLMQAVGAVVRLS